MSGINKFENKEKRRQRRALNYNHIKADLRTPKYKHRVQERKKVSGEEGDFFADRYYEDEVDW